MADKIDPNTMPDKAANMSSDRARRINSLHNKVDGMIAEQDKKRLQVSNEINSLTKEQQRLMRQLDMEKADFTNETAAAYGGVVKNLGQTIKNLSIGVKNITSDTAKATASAINQYGKAIGEDISINKQNTVAMALAKATPLFGYFAAKFMETDVFQSSAQKIKQQVSSTLSSAGESLGNIFKKKQAQEEADLPPKLQEGGFIKKGGMIEVHAAEVVSPIDKILERIDASGGEKVVEKLSHIQKEIQNLSKVGDDSQSKLLASLNELKAAMIGSADRLQVGWQKTILENPAFRAITTFSQLMDTVVKAPFKAIFGLRGGFAGDVKRATSTSNIYQQQVNLLALIYTKGMAFLRNIDKYTKVTAEALVGQAVSPTSSKTYTLFGQIKEFMTTRKLGAFRKNSFDQFAEDLNLDKAALREAGITSFKDLLSPGLILKNMGFTKENIYGKLREGPAAPIDDKTADTVYNAVFDAQFAARKFKSRAANTAAARRASQLYGKGMNVAADVGDWTRAKADRAREMGGAAYAAVTGKAEQTWKSVKTWPGRMVDELARIRKAEEDREDREGPHSPSMAENIAWTTKLTEKGYKVYRAILKRIKSIWSSVKATAKEAKRNYKDSMKNEMEKQKKLAEMRKLARQNARSTEKTSQTLEKTRKDAKGWIPMILGFFTNIGGKLLSIGRNIGKLVPWLMGPLGKMVGFMTRSLGGIAKFFAGGLGKMVTRGAGTVGKVVGGARGALAGGGIRGLMGWAGRGGMAMAGTAAAVTGGLAVGGGMALWDMAKAIISGDEVGFVGNFLVRGLAGFLGGTDTGASGMAKGALKGAALGAAIGSVVPGLGTMIGAGIGGAAGAILGFIGGAQLSDAISRSLEGLGEVVSVIWKIVKFPFTVLKEISKIIWSTLSFIGKNVFDAIDNVLRDIPIVSDIWDGLKTITSGIANAFKNLFSTIVSGIASIFSSDGEAGDIAKDILTNILFPIPPLIAGLKRIGTAIDEWLMDAPVIGKVYRWAKRFVGDVNTGELSASFNRALAGSAANAALETSRVSKNADIKKMAEADAEKLKYQAEIAKRQAEAINKNADKNTNRLNQTTVNSMNYMVANSSTSIQQPFPAARGGNPYRTGSQDLSSMLAMGNIP